MEVDAEADAFSGDVAGVVILGFWEGAAAGPKILHPGGIKRGGFHCPDGFPDPNKRNRVFTEKQVRGPEFPAGPAEILEMIHGDIVAGIGDPGNPHFRIEKGLCGIRIIS